jgi:hypothetical protein
MNNNVITARNSARYDVNWEVCFEDNGDFAGVEYWVNHTGMKSDGVWVNETVFTGSKDELGVWFARLAGEESGLISVTIEERL